MASDELIVTVIRATNLRDTQLVGTQDPYVKLCYGSHKVKTRVHEDGGNRGEWNTTFRFPVRNPDDALQVKAKNQNVLDCVLIGEVTIPSSEFTNDASDLLAHLTYKGKKAGQVLLNIQLRSGRDRQLSQDGRRLFQSVIAGPAAPSPSAYPTSAPIASAPTPMYTSAPGVMPGSAPMYASAPAPMYTSAPGVMPGSAPMYVSTPGVMPGSSPMYASAPAPSPVYAPVSSSQAYGYPGTPGYPMATAQPTYTSGPRPEAKSKEKKSGIATALAAGGAGLVAGMALGGSALKNLNPFN